LGIPFRLGTMTFSIENNSLLIKTTNIRRFRILPPTRDLLNTNDYLMVIDNEEFDKTCFAIEGWFENLEGGFWKVSHGD